MKQEILTCRKLLPFFTKAPRLDTGCIAHISILIYIVTKWENFQNWAIQPVNSQEAFANFLSQICSVLHYLSFSFDFFLNQQYRSPVIALQSWIGRGCFYSRYLELFWSDFDRQGLLLKLRNSYSYSSLSRNSLWPKIVKFFVIEISYFIVSLLGEPRVQ